MSRIFRFIHKLFCRQKIYLYCINCYQGFDSDVHFREECPGCGT